MSYDILSDINDGIENFIIIAVVAIVVYVAYTLRKMILVHLFDDTTLNVSGFTLLYWLCKCCGLCSGDWTAVWCGRCPCVPEKYRNQNLKKVLAERVGILPMNVILTNVYAGDLPPEKHFLWVASDADYFIRITGNELLEEKHSEVVTDADPNLIPFHTTFSVACRRSAFETYVRITICKNNTIGFTEVASVSIPPVVLVHWAEKSAEGPISYIDDNFHFTGEPHVVKMELEHCDTRVAGTLRKPFLVMAVHRSDTVIQSNYDSYPQNNYDSHPVPSLLSRYMQVKEEDDQLLPLVSVVQGLSAKEKDSLAKRLQSMPDVRERVRERIDKNGHKSFKKKLQEFEGGRKRLVWWKVFLGAGGFLTGVIYAFVQFNSSLCYTKYKKLTILVNNGVKFNKTTGLPIGPWHQQRYDNVSRLCHLGDHVWSRYIQSAKEKYTNKWYGKKITLLQKHECIANLSRPQVFKQCWNPADGQRRSIHLDMVPCPGWICQVDEIFDGRMQTVIIFCVFIALAGYLYLKWMDAEKANGAAMALWTVD